MDRAVVKQKLVEILERSVGEPVAGVEEQMALKEDLGLDSIDLVTMAIEAQGEFNIELSTSELTAVVKIKDLLDLIQAKLPSTQTRAA